MSRTDELYTALTSLLREAALLNSCCSVLGWDEQTYMPEKGVGFRAEQTALLAGLAHERSTSPRIGELLSELEKQGDLGPADSDRAANVREARRAYDRQTKLPRRLVEELSRTTTMSQQAWAEAREDSDFAAFLPWLEKMIGLKREEAQAVGYGAGIPYDALLDDYEPGMTAAEIQQTFSPLRDELVKLVSQIQASPRRPRVDVLTRHYPKTPQIVLAESASKAIGFDFDAGRIDESAHPFCSGFGPGDCRLTTRYNDHHFNSAFFGVLHESGHGIYDQGLPGESFGLGVGQATSLGIHESQSRLWENFVGRSRSFWNYFYPTAQSAFPKALGDVTGDEFHFAINDVRPSLIRVEADEVTYNLHIMLRFEIEQQLVSGDLKPTDVPEVWNEKMSSYFGLSIPNDANGCLQDIHWSAGLLGYFPTYTLGNLYAAQIFGAARRDLGDLDEQFTRGIFKPLKEWLNEKIHKHGRRYSARRLVELVTGETLSHEALMTHLRTKYSELYQL
ncbi:carboxypeptidase M32 [Schlesneria paludicola]|uniref:carboxypeptidase M32 n=1 Tax=Schlesneria paludicola TaxID=360056 RepID=UPI00029B2E01|nr:carboxypeptidase M32 [Schlesneria paludicola]